MRKDLSASALLAGLIAVIVSYAGPTVLLFEVAARAGLSEAQTTSWLWAYSIGSGLTGLIASWRFRMPIITAWSTPGLALLGAGLHGVPFAEAVGAFLLANLIITAIGMCGLFERLMQRIPLAIAAALLAGILFPFGLGLFKAMDSAPLSVGLMTIAYFATRRLATRWAIAAVLLTGLVLAFANGQVDVGAMQIKLAQPLWTTPRFAWEHTVSLAIPLALVSLTGQYLSGFAVLKAAGYQPPIDTLVRLTGVCSLALAPFGCHGINPAALTAAIITGPESHPNASRRYIAGIASGIAYIVFGLFAGTFVSLFIALPKAMIAALAALALLGSMTHALASALTQNEHRDAAFVTFIVTCSAVTYCGLGAAFWGVASGLGVQWFADIGLTRKRNAVE